MTTTTPRLLLDGQRFPEGLRWHGDHLWFSDVAARRVVRVGLDGVAETMAQFDDDEPSGLGFLPDGTPLVVMMWSRRLVALRATIHTYTEGGLLGGGWFNDMVVDGVGRAYVGHAHPIEAIVSPFRTDTRPPDPRGESIVLVTPDGEVRSVAHELEGPNGLVITADGSTLVVAESPLHRLTAFDIAPDGSLAGRRTYAELGDVRPDGLAIDAEGGVWVGTHSLGDGGGGCVRFTEGGIRTDVVHSGVGGGVTCALGGPERRTLFFSSIVFETIVGLREAGGCVGRIETSTVAIPGDGWP